MIIEGASALQQAMFDAVEARDTDACNDLAQRHHEAIEHEFGSWLKMPESIRGDQDRMNQYVQSLVTIAQAFAAIGVPSLLARLTGPDDSNPILIWQRRAAEAQSLSEAGEYAASSTELLAVLEEISTAQGSAVVNLRPKVLGRLGFNALHMDDYQTAVEFMSRAYEAAVMAADAEAMATYFENLHSLRLIAALAAEPERGQRLLELHRAVARAQAAADAGRYRASLDLLDAAMAPRGLSEGDALVTALAPKIAGLRGFNHFKLGDLDDARWHTAGALERARAAGDEEGVRIYRANLDAIDRASPA